MASWLDEAKAKEIEALKEVLGEGRNISEASPLPVAGSAQLNGFESNQWAGRTLNDILTGRYRPAVGAVIYNCDVDNYKHALFPQVTPLAVDDTLFLYSRLFFKYPQLFTGEVLADRTGLPDTSLLAFEFEGIRGSKSLRAGFWLRHWTGATRFYAAYTNQDAMGEFNGIDLAAYLPADYSTAVHKYICKLNKGAVEYRIDEALAAVVLYAPDSAFYTLAGPPYDIRIVPVTYDPCEAQFHLHIEDTNPFYISGFSDGEPLPLRTFPLYTTGTETSWTGLATGGTLKTSHPIPVSGYAKKTLFFQATGAGVLTVQILAGGEWRTIATPTVEANTLVVYALETETPLARCLYEPSNTDTITLAEWCLS